LQKADTRKVFKSWSSFKYDIESLSTGCPEKVPLLIKYLVRFLLEIQLKGTFFNVSSLF